MEESEQSSSSEEEQSNSSQEEHSNSGQEEESNSGQGLYNLVDDARLVFLHGGNIVAKLRPNHPEEADDVQTCLDCITGALKLVAEHVTQARENQVAAEVQEAKQKQLELHNAAIQAYLQLEQFKRYFRKQSTMWQANAMFAMPWSIKKYFLPYQQPMNGLLEMYDDYFKKKDPEWNPSDRPFEVLGEHHPDPRFSGIIEKEPDWKFNITPHALYLAAKNLGSTETVVHNNPRYAAWEEPQARWQGPQNSPVSSASSSASSTAYSSASESESGSDEEPVATQPTPEDAEAQTYGQDDQPQFYGQSTQGQVYVQQEQYQVYEQEPESQVYEPGTQAQTYEGHMYGQEPQMYGQESALYDQEPQSYGPETVSYPQETAAYPQEAASYPQEAASYPEETATYPQETVSYPQETASYPQEPASYPQETASYPQETTSYPQESASYPQETVSYRQETQPQMYEQGMSEPNQMAGVAQSYGQFTDEPYPRGFEQGGYGRVSRYNTRTGLPLGHYLPPPTHRDFLPPAKGRLASRALLLQVQEHGETVTTARHGKGKQVENEQPSVDQSQDTDDFSGRGASNSQLNPTAAGFTPRCPPGLPIPTAFPAQHSFVLDPTDAEVSPQYPSMDMYNSELIGNGFGPAMPMSMLQSSFDPTVNLPAMNPQLQYAPYPMMSQPEHTDYSMMTTQVGDVNQLYSADQTMTTQTGYGNQYLSPGHIMTPQPEYAAQFLSHDQIMNAQPEYGVQFSSPDQNMTAEPEYGVQFSSPHQNMTAQHEYGVQFSSPDQNMTIQPEYGVQFSSPDQNMTAQPEYGAQFFSPVQNVAPQEENSDQSGQIMAPQPQHGVPLYNPNMARQEENETTSESEYESTDESSGSQLVSDSEDGFKPSAAAERLAEMHAHEAREASASIPIQSTSNSWAGVAVKGGVNKAKINMRVKVVSPIVEAPRALTTLGRPRPSQTNIAALLSVVDAQGDAQNEAQVDGQNKAQDVAQTEAQDFAQNDAQNDVQTEAHDTIQTTQAAAPEPTMAALPVPVGPAEALADQLRVVVILNPPVGYPVQGISTGIKEGAIMALRTGFDSTSGNRYITIIFQFAPSATNLLAAMEHDRVIGDNSRFGFFPHCMRGLPYPRDTTLASMNDPFYARRRITLACSGLFQSWREKELELFCHSYVGAENVDWVFIYNAGNATVCFMEVDAAVQMRKVFMDLRNRGAHDRKFDGLHVSFSKDPSEFPIKLIAAPEMKDGSFSES